MPMHMRELAPHEYAQVYQMGYKEWTKGRTYEQYVKENKKEEDYGIRYAFVDKEDNIIGSLIVLSLKIMAADLTLPLYGLGSIVIDPNFRRMGLGSQMIRQCLLHYEKREENPPFILYSDIDPLFYRTFSFKELPKNQQRYPKSICMVRSTEAVFESISKLPMEQIPAYF